MNRKRVVAALGGNALLRRGEPAEADVQRRNVEQAVAGLGELAAESDLVLTHGNGPQVGLLALQAMTYPDVSSYPLDVIGAESQGMIGYLLEQELRNSLHGRPVATLLTQVIVDGDDRAFARPTKPIGPVYAEPDAERLARERGWSIARDGAFFRRVVASPAPRRIVELDAIRLLVEAGIVVICVGGGGVPVVVDAAGALRGVEAVIDKDLSAALLAEKLEADLLLVLTDVPAVMRGWGTTAARPIRHATPTDLRRLDLASGSMGPKVEAAARFVERTGKRAAIGSLNDAVGLARGSIGTQIRPGIRERPDLQSRRARMAKPRVCATLERR